MAARALVGRHEGLQFLGPRSNNIAGHAGLFAEDEVMLFMGFRELKRDVPGRSDVADLSQPAPTASALPSSFARRRGSESGAIGRLPWRITRKTAVSRHTVRWTRSDLSSKSTTLHRTLFLNVEVQSITTVIGRAGGSGPGGLGTTKKR